MKDIYIADLAGFDEGTVFDSYFLVLLKQHRTTKSNKPYPVSYTHLDVYKRQDNEGQRDRPA